LPVVIFIIKCKNFIFPLSQELSPGRRHLSPLSCYSPGNGSRERERESEFHKSGERICKHGSWRTTHELTRLPSLTRSHAIGHETVSRITILYIRLVVVRFSGINTQYTRARPTNLFEFRWIFDQFGPSTVRSTKRFSLALLTGWKLKVVRFRFVWHYVLC
jgi:hypothetical protein